MTHHQQPVVTLALFAAALGAVACKVGGQHAATAADTGFAATQARGQTVMGVNRYTSAHVFEDLPDGGRIVLDRDDPRDSVAIRTIRAHMRTIVSAFRAGDFSRPFEVHAQSVPGTAVMTARRGAISYTAIDRPRGAEVRLQSVDSTAVAAIHAFLAFQREAHHARGHEGMPRSEH